MWSMIKFWDLPKISGEEKALCRVRTCMVELEHGSKGGALNWDPQGVFSAWPHPRGHTASPFLSVDFLTENYQLVNLIKKPTNKSATCSKSKGANYLLWLSRFQMETLKKKSCVCSTSCTKCGLLIQTQQPQSQVEDRAGASFASGILIKQDDERTCSLPGDSLWRVDSFCSWQSPIISVNALMSFCDPIKSH